jgi:Fic family protein
MRKVGMIEFLTAKSGKFYFTTAERTELVNSQDIQASVLNDALLELPILPELAARIDPDIMYSSVAGTAAIEGNPIDGNDVQRLAAGENIEGYSQKHRQEIINLITAYKFMDALPSNEPVEITEDLVFGLHSMITKDVAHERNVPGRYRDGIVRVGDDSHGGVYTPPKIIKDIRDLMQVFLEWINSDEVGKASPFIRGSLAHYYLCIIHPFWDGNGRTARLLEAIVLHSAGMKYVPKELSNYYYRNVDAYYWTFSNGIRLRKDSSPFQEFSLGGIVSSLKEVKGRIVYFIRKFALRDFYRFLRRKKDISSRQFEFLGLLLDNPVSFTLQDLDEMMPFSVLYRKVSTQTVRRDLKKLTDRGILLRDDDGNYTLNLNMLG